MSDHKMQKERKQKVVDRGFTLIEVVIAIGIFTMLMLAVSMLFVFLYRQQSTSVAMIQRTDSLNRVVDTMAKEFRESSRGAKGDFALVIANTNQITFFDDIDSDGLTEKISYYLNGTSLTKSVIEPGADLLYGGTAVITVVLTDVRNGGTPIFTYYDKNYTGTQSPMSSPVEVVKVKLVGLSLTVNSVNSLNSYPLHIETKIERRNL